MKRAVSLVICLILCFSLFSCTSASDLYGAWYTDYNGIRNAIQFSENDNGDDIFIWVVYNIKSDTIESNDAGKYHIYGDTITLEYNSDIDPVTLDFELSDNTLVLSSDTARLVLEKNVIEDQ